MQEFSYLGEITLVSIWARMVFDQNTNSWIQKHPTWRTHHQSYVLLGILNLKPTNRFFATIDGVDYWHHALTCILDEHGVIQL
jgi:hypothetical protein